MLNISRRVAPRASLRMAMLATTAFAVPALAETAASPLPPPPAAAAPAARSGAGSDVSTVGEVIVTAQKRSQQTQKIGFSIAAFNTKQLETLGVKDISDLAKVVPGFTAANSFRGPPIYTLRGVGFNTPNMSTSSPVGVYLDEVAYPYPIMTEGLNFDLERVEVLKGPQGTLYGRNTTGGLINDIARKPTDEEEGDIRVGYGSYQSYNVEGGLGGPLLDTLTGRVAFSIDKSDEGWQRNIITGDRLGKVDKDGARVSLKWQPNNKLNVLLTGNFTHDGSDTVAGQSIYIFAKGLAAQGIPESEWATVGPELGVPPALLTQAFHPTSDSQANWNEVSPQWGGTVGGHNWNPPPTDRLYRDNNMASVALRAEYKLPYGVTLTSLSNYSSFTRNETVDPSGTALEDGLSNELGFIHTVSQELRLSGETEQFNWIGGLFYANDRIHEVDKNWAAVTTDVDPLRIIGSAVLPPGSTEAQIQDVRWGFRDWQNQDDQTVTTKAVFGQSEYRFAPHLSLTTGFRYTADQTLFSGCSRDQGDDSIAATWNGFFNYYLGIPSNVAPGGCVTYLSDLTSHVIPNPAYVPLSNPTEFLIKPGSGAFPTQGLVEERLSESNLAGRIGLDWQARPNLLVYGYVARGYKSGAFPNVSANVATQYDPAKQEELIAYETGVKSRPFWHALANAAVFYYDYTNKQAYGYVPDLVYGTLERIINIPKSHLYGAEAEVATPVPMVDNLTLHGTASYLKSDIDQYTGYDDFGVTHNFRGASFTFTPEFQADAAATYDQKVTDAWNSEWTLSARYSSHQQGDLLGDPRFAIRSYTLFDANVNFSTDKDKYEIQFFAKNLANTYYWTSVQYFEDSVVRYAGMPRTWGVALKAYF